MIAQLRRLAWSTWRPIAERAARAYVAGPELAHALHVCRELARQGMATTICPWDAEGDNPRQVADWYLAALEGLAGAGLDCYLSIKAPSLGFSRDLLGELLEAAQRQAVGIHLDSLAPETAERTWELIKAVVPRQARVGCTLPARWHRSLRDADEAVDLGLPVRIVKGQWADRGGETRLPDLEIRERFLAVVRTLAGRARRVAVATHDPALARPALECLRAAGTACELELLFGLPVRSVLPVAQAAGVPVRLYVPYGHAWLPYCLSQARQHPHILWWTMRDWLLGWRRPDGLQYPGASSRG